MEVIAELVMVELVMADEFSQVFSVSDQLQWT